MRYVYGIMLDFEQNNLGCVGLHGEAVDIIHFNDICALAGDLGENCSITLEDARMHERVLMEAMKNGAIIPLGFGFFAESDVEIGNLLRRGYFVFRDVLDRLRGKIQEDVKVSWDNQIFGLLDDEKVSVAKERLRKAPEDVMLKIELGRAIDASLMEMKKKLLPMLLEKLNKAAIDSKWNKVKNNDTLLNISFLLEDERLEDFLDAAIKLEGNYGDILKFTTVGPLPPYNFVNIRVEKPDYDELGEAVRALGLGEEVSLCEVERAFNRLARKTHPDSHHDQSSEQAFNALKRARDTLIEYCEGFPCPTRRSDLEDKLIIKELSR